MIVCPNCNHHNPEGATQCEACYTPLPEMMPCPNCGASVQVDANFCGQCGFSIQSPPDASLPTALESSSLASASAMEAAGTVKAGAMELNNLELSAEPKKALDPTAMPSSEMRWSAAAAWTTSLAPINVAVAMSSSTTRRAACNTFGSAPSA